VLIGFTNVLIGVANVLIGVTNVLIGFANVLIGFAKVLTKASSDVVCGVAAMSDDASGVVLTTSGSS